jgi:hypothetical protein
MALRRLESLVPPPATPTAASGDFAEVEADLGTALPADYKELVRRYGYGSFCELLHLWSPFFGPCTMMEQAREVLDADTQLARVAPNAVPFARYPEPDGALPWARSDNGDVAYWLTWGEPKEWPVALWNPRGGERYDLVEGGAAAFLAAWIGGEPPLSLFRRPAIRSFDPWRARVHETIALSAASGPFEMRLEALRAAFDPVEMRGAYGDEDDDDKRQVHFVADHGAVRISYDTVYGHNVRLAAPAEQIDAARACVENAAATMGSTVVRVIRS